MVVGRHRRVDGVMGQQLVGVLVVDDAADRFALGLVGTLVEIGRGRWQPKYIEDILAAMDRNTAGPIAPACELCLMEINY